jgi:hypothetical protein
MSKMDEIEPGEIVPAFGPGARVKVTFAGFPLDGFVSGMRIRQGVDEYEVTTDAGGYFWFPVTDLEEAF